jgi:hypothetical protein
MITVLNTNDPPSIPGLVSPDDDSELKTTTVTFNWSESFDPDVNDFVVNYTLQYSLSSDFQSNVINVTGIVGTSYTPTIPLNDKSTYYWHVQAIDSNGVGSGYQTTYYVFNIKTDYVEPSYNRWIDPPTVRFGETWIINLDDYFQMGTITEGVVYTCNHDEIIIDQINHTASWTPENSSAVLENVVFTLSDGRTNKSSFPIDFTAAKKKAQPTILDQLFWPWTLIPFLLIIAYASFQGYKRRKERPIVEEVFLIYEDGRLITHESVWAKEELDQDILSSMLTGVKDLISDAFVRGEEGKEEKGLQKLEFGEKSIFLEKGNKFFIAIIFTGIENKALFSKIDDVVNELEENYGDILESWDGDQKAFFGTSEIIWSLLSNKAFSQEQQAALEEERPDGIDPELVSTTADEGEVYGEVAASASVETVQPEEPVYLVPQATPLSKPEKDEFDLEQDDDFLSDLEGKIKELEAEGKLLQLDPKEDMMGTEVEDGEPQYVEETIVQEVPEDEIEAITDEVSELEDDVFEEDSEEETDEAYDAEPEGEEEITSEAEYEESSASDEEQDEVSQEVLTEEDELELRGQQLLNELEAELRALEEEQAASEKDVEKAESENTKEKDAPLGDDEKRMKPPTQPESKDVKPAMVPLRDKEEDIMMSQLDKEIVIDERDEETLLNDMEERTVTKKPKPVVPSSSDLDKPLPQPELKEDDKPLPLRKEISPPTQKMDLPPPPGPETKPTSPTSSEETKSAEPPKDKAPAKIKKSLPPPPEPESELTMSDYIKKAVSAVMEDEEPEEVKKTEEVKMEEEEPFDDLEKELLELERTYKEFEDKMLAFPPKEDESSNPDSDE